MACYAGILCLIVAIFAEEPALGASSAVRRGSTNQQKDTAAQDESVEQKPVVRSVVRNKGKALTIEPDVRLKRSVSVGPDGEFAMHNRQRQQGRIHVAPSATEEESGNVQPSPCRVTLYEGEFPEGDVPEGDVRVFEGPGTFPLVNFSRTSSVKVEGDCCSVSAYTDSSCTGTSSSHSISSASQIKLDLEGNLLNPFMPIGVVTPASNLVKYWDCNDCAPGCVKVEEDCTVEITPPAGMDPDPLNQARCDTCILGLIANGIMVIVIVVIWACSYSSQTAARQLKT